MLKTFHLPIYKQGIVFFVGRTLFPSASCQTHHFWGFEYFLFTLFYPHLNHQKRTIFEGMTWFFLVNFLSIHPHRGRFLEPQLSQGESLDKEFHRCVKVLLEPDKSLGDEEKSEETHKKRGCVEENAPFPRGGAQSLLSFLVWSRFQSIPFITSKNQKNAVCRQTKKSFKWKLFLVLWDSFCFRKSL